MSRRRIRFDSELSCLSLLEDQSFSGHTNQQAELVSSNNNYILFEQRACTLVPDKRDFKKVRHAKIIKLQKKLAFLNRCNDQKILLPQSRKKGMDRDLCLEQQRRRSIDQKLTLEEMSKGKIKNRLDPSQEKNCRRHWTAIYNKKFEKLFNQQIKKSHRREKNKEKRRNYKKRRKKALNEKRENAVKACIWNRSSRILSKPEEDVLMKGLQFVPTPDLESCYNSEYIQGAKTERRLMWDSVFSSNEKDENIDDLNPGSEDYKALPNKLKIEKHNLPNEGDVSNRTKAISQEIISSIRNLREKLKTNKMRQNLSKNQRHALKNLSKYNDIVIVKSDKDHKIIILNKDDYISLLKKNIDKNLKKVNGQMDVILKEIKDEIDQKCKMLTEQGVISKTLLYATTGLRQNEDDNHVWYTKTRQYAHVFSSKDAYSHAYLLIKSHKINSDFCPPITDIATIDLPARMVTAGTHSVTQRATTMLELIYQQPVIDFIKEEYLRDSFSYLKSINTQEYIETLKIAQEASLEIASENGEREHLFIVAIDVVSLYPSASIKHVETGLVDALVTASDFNDQQIETLVELSSFLINNNILGFKGEAYKNKHGLITGDANSVSLANCLVGQVTRNLKEKCANHEFTCLLWRRFIDDGICHLIGSRRHVDQFINLVKGLFKSIDLDITSRFASFHSEEKAIEFLDVEHVFTGDFSYETRQFIKKTAKNALYINGKSWHPPSVYKSIIHSQAYRHEFLHSTREGYLEGLERMKDKAIRSGFNVNMLENMINSKIENYKGQKAILDKEKDETEEKDIICFASQFPKYHQTLRNLKSDSGKQIMTVYKKPPAIKSLMLATKYRRISNETVNNGDNGMHEQYKCGKGRCALCVMVEPRSNIQDSLGQRSYNFKHSLTCIDYGIYILRCRKCAEQNAKQVATYVGRTSTRFNTRFNDHRKNFKEGIGKNVTNSSQEQHQDKYALAMHYVNHHSDVIGTGKYDQIKDAYTLHLVDKPSKMSFLPHLEDIWFQKVRANINIQKMTTNVIHEIV